MQALLTCSSLNVRLSRTLIIIRLPLFSSPTVQSPSHVSFLTIYPFTVQFIAVLLHRLSFSSVVIAVSVQLKPARICLSLSHDPAAPSFPSLSRLIAALASPSFDAQGF